MKKFIYTFLAVIIAAFSAPAFAQDAHLPDYGEIKVSSDRTFDDGSRLVSADPFRIGTEGGTTAYLSLHVLLDPGQAADFKRGLWYASLSVTYDGDSYHGRDTNAPFNDNDLLTIKDYHDGARLDLRLFHAFPDTGDGWHGAAFRFDYDKMYGMLMGSDPCELKYTQGAGAGGPYVGFQCVGLGVALIDSLLAILGAL